MKRNARRNPAGVRNSFSLRLLKMRSMRDALQKKSSPRRCCRRSSRRRPADGGDHGRRSGCRSVPQIVSDVKGIRRNHADSRRRARGREASALLREVRGPLRSSVVPFDLPDLVQREGKGERASLAIRLSAQILPPWYSTICLVMASPRPVPSALFVRTSPNAGISQR